MLNRQYTLRIQIAGIFVLIISFLSGFIALLNHHNAKLLNEDLGRERIAQNSQQIHMAFQRLVAPLLTSLDVLAVSDFGQQIQSPEGDQWVAAVNAIMEQNPDVLSIYLGYPSNDSAFIHSTQPEFMKSELSAPNDSHLMLVLNSATGKQVRTYYNKQLAPITSNIQTTQYLPTTRPWYQSTSDDHFRISAPYSYYSMQRMGVTLSKSLPDKSGVIAADITLESLNQFLVSLTPTPQTQLALFDTRRNILASNGFLAGNAHSNSHDERLNSLRSSPLNALLSLNDWQETSLITRHNNESWVLNLVPIRLTEGHILWLAKATPEYQLIGNAIDAENNQLKISFVGLLFGLLMVMWAAKHIAHPLSQLSRETRKIQTLDFSAATMPHSNITEMKSLTESISLMTDTILQFLETLQRVSNSSDLNVLLQDIVSYCQSTAEADFVQLWTSDADKRLSLNLTASYPETLGDQGVDLETLLSASPEVDAALGNQQFYIYTPTSSDIEQGTAPSGLERAWLLPLQNRDKERVGYVLLGFRCPISARQEDKLLFISQFLGFASLIKENWDSVSSQKQLFKSFVEMMASAIDTKSPYTGGHCQRVPELTFMLAEAAHRNNTYFREFSLSEQNREALYFASWLHDCGKVTTPEFVVDKATKLETIYNRIHEIRMRFEVLKRDAEITYWRKRCEGEAEDTLNEWLLEQHKNLDDEFAFVAKCNLGSEGMDENNINKLNKIANRRWLRTLDDTLGLSWEEEARRTKRPTLNAPCYEPLLADNVEHQMHWHPEQLRAFEQWSFKLDVPPLHYNRGELYNLSISRGTLTEEERFVVNNHIVQTIEMLQKLPYPKHLRRVPEIAGGHHEKLSGTGYPKGLDELDLPLDARIIALADIFEALTACDRPYKKAKPLSEALTILAYMVKDRHIDKHLFRLFIEEKIYLHYAGHYLPETQQDAVDETALMAIVES